MTRKLQLTTKLPAASYKLPAASFPLVQLQLKLKLRPSQTFLR